ncbi:MAG TPA: polyprenyl synthetase family protein [Chthoniobacterales bacterium]|nr:polyprenyl synthetase family protein [Chthoniobacterales bacterium]
MEVTVPTAFTPTIPNGPLSRVTEVVRPELDEVESRIISQASSFDPAVEGYVSYAIGGRGKRLRPLMALLSGGAVGAINSEHVDLAVIVELIHVATLVHDDIVDEAEWRRAQPTLNARWGNSLSVLLGDWLFAHALNLSARFDDVEVSREIARAAREVCTGEIIQTQRRFDLHLGIDDYLRIVEMKTGSLFAAAADLGAMLSKADQTTRNSLRIFGQKIGTAYQIYDDCIDIAGSERLSGKTLGSDLRKGKMTLPVLMLLSGRNGADKEHFSQLILDARFQEIAELLTSSGANGALTASLDAGQALISEAQSQVEALASNKYSDALIGLGDALREMLEQFRS